MDDITDLPFRQLCKEMGADLLITEFIASEALNRDAEKSLRKMRFTEEQRPIGIQIFGADEDELLRCLDVVEQAQPDFIDINWGCPVRKVAGKGAGSGILQDIPKMLRITAAMVRHAHLPVTVKTRLGYSHDSMMITDFCEALQDTGIAALSIHGRTKTQMYSGVADWTMIGEVKNNPRMTIPIFGNGDITTAAQAVDNKSRYGVDGSLSAVAPSATPGSSSNASVPCKDCPRGRSPWPSAWTSAAATCRQPSTSKANAPPSSRCANTMAMSLLGKIISYCKRKDCKETTEDL